MLRCNLELTAYMIFAKFIEKIVVVFVVNKIVKSYSGAYKHFFYTGYVAKLAQKRKIFTVVCFHVFAGIREKTLAVFACTVFELCTACRHPEICRGAAHIVDISLKVGVVHHLFCLGYD